VRGRKAKPTALRILEGNPGRRPIRHEPQPRWSALTRPKLLSVEARREWDRLAPEMSRLKLLTMLDAALFTAYCVVWGHWVDCERVISSSGMTQTSPRGIVRIRPEVRLSLRYAEQLRSITSDFGMNPTSRTRLDVPVLDSDDDDLLGPA
jgi:P27 family predicted phage terminase small subunit